MILHFLFYTFFLPRGLFNKVLHGEALSEVQNLQVEKSLHFYTLPVRAEPILIV